jgi:hypothetical protein
LWFLPHRRWHSGAGAAFAAEVLERMVAFAPAVTPVGLRVVLTAAFALGKSAAVPTPVRVGVPSSTLAAVESRSGRSVAFTQAVVVQLGLPGRVGTPTRPGMRAVWRLDPLEGFG